MEHYVVDAQFYARTELSIIQDLLNLTEYVDASAPAVAYRSTSSCDREKAAERAAR